MISIKEPLMMPVKGILRNTLLVIVYTLSILLYIASVFVTDVLEFANIPLDDIAVIGIRGAIIAIIVILQTYALGVLARTAAEQEFKIQSAGLFNSLGLGFKMLLLALPYYLIFTGSLFFYGTIAYVFTIVYLGLLIICAPAILLLGSRRLIDGINPVAIGKRVFEIDYLISLGVGLVVLLVYALIIYAVNTLAFIIIASLGADLTSYGVVVGISYFLTAILALFAVFSYVALFFKEPRATDEKPVKKEKKTS